ncbi:general stress protein [Pseudomonas luteola]|uniref:General stress protein n=1 Tax=Pseudomonas luteola TaxID=47886 RepID=A0ABS0FRX2_PSELU|nr:general stress protein [Pseudomonas zeshuii]MBF8643067.1 general stress protein [Pseudomonas zeshuii]
MKSTGNTGLLQTFPNDREKASEAGKKGGQNSGGNFANDREKASEAGKKGGEHSHGGGRQ